MPTSTARPPFAWLGSATPAVAAVVITGLAFRFWHLNTLPPGLYEGQAAIGLQALDLLEKGRIPGLDATNNFAPLWVWLQAISIKLLGHTELALRVWSALLGSLAVLTTWLWARSWFGPRVGWVAAFLLAVSPWAVTLSRNGLEAGALPLVVTLTLWLATRAWQRPTILNHLLLAAAIAMSLLSGPIGWLLAATVLAIGLVELARTHKLTAINRPRIVGLAGLTAGLAGLGYLVATSLDALKHLPQAAGLTTNIGVVATNLLKTLLMFNVFGDENYRHNLSGQPMLNVFVGLMLVAGILVAVARLHQRRYRLLFVLVIALLMPAIVTTVGAPNAARAAAALPLILALAAVGTSYMLELWYMTFPINSAARSVGQAAIIVLLGLTAFQGYTQYFRAWAGSSQVYSAYNESIVQMARNLKTSKFSGQRFVVGGASDHTIMNYLSHSQPSYRPITAADITTLPVESGARLFMIAPHARNEATKTLKLKFPGGVLRPHYSSFNQTEIYYTYEVTK